MKILVDADELLEKGLITGEIAALLKNHALRDTGSTAINVLLAFGAIAVAAGLAALTMSIAVAGILGAAFVALGWLVRQRFGELWGKLGSIWMVIGALVLAGSIGMLTTHPLWAALAAAVILFAVGIMAQSRLLIALTPLALAAAIGGSTGYWFACYEIVVQEPTLTIVLFAILTWLGWRVVKMSKDWQAALALSFTRMCIILVNMGFWIGSLWGDTPGRLWRDHQDSFFDYVPGNQQIIPLVFVVAWLAALAAAGAWAAREGRRFLVNTVAVFGAIHLYTQWFERFGADPIAVILAGILTIAIGLGLWQYNRSIITQPG
jgi:hypothetical protein